MQTETLIKLEPGQTVHPFDAWDAGRDFEFLPVDLVHYYTHFNSLTPNFSEPLLKVGIEFQGFKGNLSLHANAQTFNLDRGNYSNGTS